MEIWAGLTPEQRDEVALRLYNAKCCRTRQTIFNWATGRTSPVEPLVKSGVAAVLSKYLGQTVIASSLFIR